MRVLSIIPIPLLLTPVFATGSRNPVPSKTYTAPKIPLSPFAPNLLGHVASTGINAIQQPRPKAEGKLSQFTSETQQEGNVASASNYNRDGSEEDEETDPFASYEAMVNKLVDEDEFTSPLESSQFSRHPSVEQSSNDDLGTAPKTSLSAFNPAVPAFVTYDTQRAQLKKSFSILEQQWHKQKMLLDERMKSWHSYKKYNVNVQTALNTIQVVTEHIRTRHPRNKYLFWNKHGNQFVQFS